MASAFALASEICRRLVHKGGGGRARCGSIAAAPHLRPPVAELAMSRELSGKTGRRPLSMAGASQMVTPAAPRAELLTEGGHQHEVIAVPLPAPAQTSQSYQRYSSRMSMTLARGGSSDSVIDLRRIGSDDDDTTKESYVGEKLSFFRSLPRSCRAFLFLTLVVTVTNTVHGVVLIAMGGVMHAESVTRAKNFLYYGVSQVMLGLRIFKFAWDFLRKEHSVYMQMALLLIVYIALFDLSLLESVLSGDDAARAEGGGDRRDRRRRLGHRGPPGAALDLPAGAAALLRGDGPLRPPRVARLRLARLQALRQRLRAQEDVRHSVCGVGLRQDGPHATIQVPLAAPARPRPPPAPPPRPRSAHGPRRAAPPAAAAAHRRAAPLAPSVQVALILVIFLLHGEQAIFTAMGEKIFVHIAISRSSCGSSSRSSRSRRSGSGGSARGRSSSATRCPPARPPPPPRRQLPPPAAPPASRSPPHSRPPPRSHPLALRPPPALLRVQVGPHLCQRDVRSPVQGLRQRLLRNVSGVDLDGDALAEAILLECGVNPPPTHEGSFSFTAEYWCTRAYESIWEVPVLVPAMLSAAMRVGTYVKIYLASTRVFGEAAAAVDEHGVVGPRRPPRVDRRRGAGAIVRMVKGAELNIVVCNDADDDADVSKRGGAALARASTVAAALLPAARSSGSKDELPDGSRDLGGSAGNGAPAAAPPSGSSSSRLVSSARTRARR